MDKHKIHFLSWVAATLLIPQAAPAQQPGDPFFRHVLVEEGSGTRCANCPRGMVGMERVKETWPEQAIVIAVHQYDKRDPMYIGLADYPNCDWVGFPDCTVNRGRYHYDPFYGNVWASETCAITDYISSYFTQTRADVGISATAHWNADSTAVEATATIETTLPEGNAYEVQFMLVADSLRGEDNAWVQSNIYYNKEQSALPDELKPFGIGGTLWNSDGGTRVVYNDVAIASSYRLGRTQVPQFADLKPGEQRTVGYTLKMPEVSDKNTAVKNMLPPALHKDKVWLVACVADQWGGNLYNCVRVPVSGPSADAIILPLPHLKKPATQYFAPDGRQLYTPRRGLNIVRRSDGTMVKLLKTTP